MMDKIKNEGRRMPFGNYLAQKLEELGWDQARLARESGVKRSTISIYIMEPNRQPDYNNLRRISHAFGMSSDEFWDEASGIKRSETFIRGYLPDIPPERQMELAANKFVDQLRIFHPPSIPVYPEPFIRDSVERYVPALINNDVDATKLFAYEVKIDYMEPDIKRGDLLIFHKDLVAELGDIVCALSEESNVTFGRLQHDSRNEMIIRNKLGDHTIRTDKILVAMRVNKWLKRPPKPPQ